MKKLFGNLKKTGLVVLASLFLFAGCSGTTGNNEKPGIINSSLNTVEMAKNMAIGWNLGNTLDATNNKINCGTETETAWGMPATTKAMIDAVKAAGFKTIRIPVSWHNHVTNDGNYTINSEWMARVKQIVDWAIADDLYVILNVHHDNLSVADINKTPGFALSTTDASVKAKSNAYLEKVWTQIATVFNNSYGEKLVFEVLNEPRAVGSANEWYFSTSASAKPYCDVITEYENTCIKAIRATGGNNAERYIMVPGYAASGSDKNMLEAYTMPEDSAGKLILSTHAYSPFAFAMSNSDSVFGSDDEASLVAIFNYLKTKYVDNGIGVVMGEASASNKDNTQERIKWAKSYFKKAYDIGIPVVLWDNMIASPDGHEGANKNEYNGEHHGWLERNECKWFFPDIIKAMMDTVGITNVSIPGYVESTPETIGWNDGKAVTVSTTGIKLGWDDSCKIEKSNFANAEKGSILKLTFANSGAAFKIRNSSWTTYFEGKMLGGTVNKTAGDSYGVITASSTVFYYVLTEADAAAWKSQDVYISGQNGSVTGIYFLAK